MNNKSNNKPNKKLISAYSNKHICNRVRASNPKYKIIIKNCIFDYYVAISFWITLFLFLVIYLPILFSGKRRQFNTDNNYNNTSYNTINFGIQNYIKANYDITKNKYKKLLTISLLQDIKMGDHCRIPIRKYLRNITIKLASTTFIVVKFNKKLYFVNELHLEKRNKK